VLNLKTGLFLSAALFASSSFADTQAVELSQLSNGTEVEATYMASCFACHSTGAAGAPKVGPGNADAWTARLEKGMDQIVTNAIAGINNMPPKGLCFTCNDDDIKLLVEYMIDSSK
jgi:cytochrome c5